MNCVECGKPIWPNKSGMCRLHANRRPRTPEMDERLRDMAGAHATARDIATALDLSERSVRARAVEIGVGFTKGRRRA